MGHFVVSHEGGKSAGSWFEDAIVRVVLDCLWSTGSDDGNCKCGDPSLRSRMTTRTSNGNCRTFLVSLDNQEEGLYN